VSGQHLPSDLEQSLTSRGSRPWQVTAAVPLLAPAAAAWGAAGVAVFRHNADDGVVPLILFALPLSGVLVAVSAYGLVGLVGLVGTWRGSRPGCGTYLPAIVMVVSMIGLGLAFHHGGIARSRRSLDPRTGAALPAGGPTMVVHGARPAATPGERKPPSHRRTSRRRTPRRRVMQRSWSSGMPHRGQCWLVLDRRRGEAHRHERWRSLRVLPEFGSTLMGGVALPWLSPFAQSWNGTLSFMRSSIHAYSGPGLEEPCASWRAEEVSTLDTRSERGRPDFVSACAHGCPTACMMAEGRRSQRLWQDRLATPTESPLVV
jgi:hypothetical protein